MYAKAKKSGHPDHDVIHKKLKRESQKALRQAFWLHLDRLFTEENFPIPLDSSPRGLNKRFWSYVKLRKTENTGVSPLKENGKLVTNPSEIGRVMNEQFKSAFSEREEIDEQEFERRCPGLIGPMPERGPNLSDIDIQTEGVEKMLKDLDPNKAAGPDNISPKFLKLVAVELAPALTTLYRASLKQGTVPSDWKKANVTPVFKKGERYKAENYRPISLTSVPCKLMEHVIVHSLMKHLEENDLLRQEQHGFRRGRSCESQLLGLIDEITQELENGNQEDLIALDFSKAFDKVNHSLLIHKLKRYGIDGNVKLWIQSFLQDRQQSVIVEGTSSAPIPVESGVPQGSVLGPALFLIYIDDLPEAVQSKTRLFADDTTCCNTIKSAEDQAQLQNDLNSLITWEERWSMSFHPKKCQVLNVVGKKKPRKFNYQIHGEELQSTSEVKYLGVTITKDLRWKAHITNIYNRANKMLGFLRRNLRITNKRLKDHAYKAFIRPLLEYACAVWDPYYDDDIQMLEKVQKRAARWVTNRFRRTSHVSEMLQTLSWPPLESRRSKIRLETFFKFHKGLTHIESKHLPRKKPNKTNKMATRSSHSQEYEEPNHPRLYRLKAFFPRTVAQWNLLPEEVVSADTLDLFKARVARLI
jgi:hypothetical protein